MFVLVVVGLLAAACSSSATATPEPSGETSATQAVSATAVASPAASSPTTAATGAASPVAAVTGTPVATATPVVRPATPTPTSVGSPATSTPTPTAISTATPPPLPTTTATPPPLPTATATPAPAGVEVVIQGFGYQPQQLVIDAGTAVTWINRDPVQHDADATDGSWDAPLLSEGGTWARSFDTAGEFLITCSVHPFMQSLVTVR